MCVFITIFLFDYYTEHLLKRQLCDATRVILCLLLILESVSIILSICSHGSMTELFCSRDDKFNLKRRTT